MCGRAVQTRRSIESAEEILHQQCNQDNIQFNPSPCSTIFQNDNYNLAPGSHGVVFHASQHNNTDSNADSNADASHSSSAAGAPSNKPATTTSSAGTVIVSSAKTWGLCPKNGTINHPLPDGPGKHFSNLMYNARSDTLYSKRTFSKLALESQTCLWPVHGYYEWKHDEGDVLLSKGKGGKRKQPYLVKRREKERDGGNRNGNRKPSFLLIPGLWNRVKTGRKIIRIEAVEGEGMNACTNTGQEILQDEFIETFTLITTEACSSLQWLHHRQPILLDNLDLAMEWLLHPNSDVLNRMRKEAKDMGLGLGEELLLTAGDGDIIKNTKEKNTQNGNGLIEWYPVTKNMSKLGYKSKDCVDQIKIEKVASVKSFFTAAGGEKRKSSCTTSVGGDEAKINVGVFAANGAGTGAGTGVAFASASPLKRTKVETNKMKVGMNGNSARSPRKSKSQSPGKAKVAEDRGGSIASFFTKKAQKK